MEENSVEKKEEQPNWESIAKYKAAELDNYIKRHRDAVGNAFNDGRAKVIVELLPIGDALGEALKILKTDADKKGIEMLIRKFDNILETHGVEILEVKQGDKFDPYIHNAISSGGEKIKEVLAKGYKFSGKVIRPAMVILN